jgi:multidrug efflux pump subunit AcrB
VLTIGVLLGDVRAALIALVTIPLSLAAGGIVLLVAGATINAVVVAGLVLAIGILVDDAVVAYSAIEARARSRPPRSGRQAWPRSSSTRRSQRAAR